MKRWHLLKTRRAAAVLRCWRESAMFKPRDGRRWLHRETVDDRQRRVLGFGSFRRVLSARGAHLRLFLSAPAGSEELPQPHTSLPTRAKRHQRRQGPRRGQAPSRTACQPPGRRTARARPPRASCKRRQANPGALRRAGSEPAPRLRRRRAALPEAAAAHVCQEERHGAA